MLSRANSSLPQPRNLVASTGSVVTMMLYTNASMKVTAISTAVVLCRRIFPMDLNVIRTVSHFDDVADIDDDVSILVTSLSDDVADKDPPSRSAGSQVRSCSYPPLVCFFFDFFEKIDLIVLVLVLSFLLLLSLRPILFKLLLLLFIRGKEKVF